MVSCLFTFLKQATKTLTMLKLLKISPILLSAAGQENFSSCFPKTHYFPGSNFSKVVTCLKKSLILGYSIYRNQK